MSGWKQYRILVLTRTTRVYGFASLLFLLSASSAFAQIGERVDAPVTVTVESKQDAFGTQGSQKAFVPLGGTARLSGTSVTLGDKDTVSINITAPDKSTKSLNGKLTQEGTYAVTFTGTNTPGTYTVTAKSPDGKSTAKASFTVVSALEIGETTEKLFSALTQITGKTGKTVQAVQEIIDDQGDFPGRTKIDHDLEEIVDALEKLPVLLDDMRDAIGQLSKLIEEYPGVETIPELAEMAKELSNALDEAETMNEQLDDLYVRMTDELSICDRIDMMNEALSFTEMVLDFVSGTWVMRANALMVKMGIPEDIYNALFPDGSSLESKTVFTETVENAIGLFTKAADTVEDFVKSPQGLVLTVTQYILELNIGDMCERFVGPIEGTFSVDSTLNGQQFWGYKTYIKGRLILRYETKYKTGKDPIPLTGEFEGTATKFDVYENLYVTGGELIQSKIMARFLVKPIAVGDVINWIGLKAGPLPAMAIPKYFKVRVTGSYSLNDSVTINIAPTGIVDFGKDLHSTAYYVLLPSAIIPIPLVEHFDIHMEDAQYILSRGLRNTSTMKVATGKSSKGSLLSTIEQTFTREEVVSNGEVTVKWNVNVKACNPECD